MGCCCSRNKSCQEVLKPEPELVGQRKKSEQESSVMNKEVSKGKTGEEGKVDGRVGVGIGGGGAPPVRTSSCTREEVDAILIECGRLSRSSSTGKGAYSSENGGNNNGDDETGMKEERDSHRRERLRQSPGRSRRRTPSREREKESEGERDKDQAAEPPQSGGGGGGSGRRRRTSRSPGRRSPGRRAESPVNNSRADSNPNLSAPAAADKANSRPGKMVSVPPTVSSLAIADKITNGSEANASKRVQAKRSAGGASPRTRSPARLRASNENQQPISLSRSNSRKAEQSPYRRNPLSEIDSNVIIISQVPGPAQKPKPEESKGLNVISSSGQEKENLKSLNVARSRSSRPLQNLDNTNPEVLPTNPNGCSYTALLLEDIQNFHQKINPPPPAFSSLPPCVTKACSILEAVADLNSSIGSNLSSTLCEDTQRNLCKHDKQTSGNTKQDPILESEVKVKGDDLMEPSFQKYVTVGRDSGVGEDMEMQESSGSNSVLGNQQQGVLPSRWEPSSADSTECLASSSSRSLGRQNKVSPAGLQRNQSSESGEGGKRLSASKRKESGQQNRVGKGMLGTRSSHMAAVAN